MQVIQPARAVLLVGMDLKRGQAYAPLVQMVPTPPNPAPVPAILVMLVSTITSRVNHPLSARVVLWIVTEAVLRLHPVR